MGGFGDILLEGVGALFKSLDKALDDSYLYGDGLGENKEIFDILIEKWKDFFSNPKLFGKIDREINGDILVCRWFGGNSLDGEMDYSYHPRYLCRCDGEEFYYSYYDDKNLEFEFTKNDIKLLFSICLSKGEGLALQLSAKPKNGKEKSAIVLYSYPPFGTLNNRWADVNYEKMFRKMELYDFYEKISAFVKHFKSHDSFTEKMEQEIIEKAKKEQEKLRIENEKKRLEEKERQRAIEEAEKLEEENMNRLRNL